MSALSDAEGEQIVKAARAGVEAEASDRGAPEVELPPAMDEKRGVFVTLNIGKQLRGCIGIVLPYYKASEALRIAAEDVCHDPRFPPLKPDETDRCTVEVSVLTVPEKIEYSSTDDLQSQINIGEDGLVLYYKRSARVTNNAVFLPQVPVEQGWDTEQYLSELCAKAGLQDSAWRSGVIEFYKFSAEVFGEETPNGKVKRV